MRQSIIAALSLSAATSVLAMPAHMIFSRQGQCSSSSDCPSGMCCSQYGYCGSGSAYCPASGGGQGSCSSSSDCGSGMCCSQYGYCGTGSEYCGSSGGGGSTGGGGGGSSGGGGGVTCTGRQLYEGNGSDADGWPDESTWASFDTLWSVNLNTIDSSCSQWSQANNSPQETSDLQAAIQSVASSSGVDPRFILAIIMQESKGCVRVPTTYYSVSNPGLMQDHAGSHTCYNVNPCPDDEIVGMIQDGTQGTSSGQGLQQILAGLSTTGSQQVYQAARIYNSGSIPADGNLSEGGSTSSYASDIADRLGGCVF